MYSPDDTRTFQHRTTELLRHHASDDHFVAAHLDTLRDVLRFHEYRYYILNDPLI